MGTSPLLSLQPFVVSFEHFRLFGCLSSTFDEAIFAVWQMKQIIEEMFGKFLKLIQWLDGTVQSKILAVLPRVNIPSKMFFFFANTNNASLYKCNRPNFTDTKCSWFEISSSNYVRSNVQKDLVGQYIRILNVLREYLVCFRSFCLVNITSTNFRMSFIQ